MKKQQGKYIESYTSMTYNTTIGKELIPQVLVETSPYQRAVTKLWDEETQTEFKNFIGMNPEAGDIIPDTGGIRKVRWESSGRGKRGGARVIYYLYNENHPIYLLYAYPKNKQVNLTEAEKKVFKAVVEQLKAVFRDKEAGRHE